jgi:hypothetical protein
VSAPVSDRLVNVWKRFQMPDHRKFGMAAVTIGASLWTHRTAASR